MTQKPAMSIETKTGTVAPFEGWRESNAQREQYCGEPSLDLDWVSKLVKVRLKDRSGVLDDSSPHEDDQHSWVKA